MSVAANQVLMYRYSIHNELDAGGADMKKIRFAALVAIFVLGLSVSRASAFSKTDEDQDPDDVFINARVVEVTDGHISVVARSGVEHVIAIDLTKTRVIRRHQEVSPKDLRAGDVITVELDPLSRLKLAQNVFVKTEEVSFVRNRW
jgi:hypothetical protein